MQDYRPIRCRVHTQQPTWILSGVYLVCTALTITGVLACQSLGAASGPPALALKRTAATTGKEDTEGNRWQRQKGSLVSSFQCSSRDPISSPSTSYQRAFSLHSEPSARLGRVSQEATGCRSSLAANHSTGKPENSTRGAKEVGRKIHEERFGVAKILFISLNDRGRGPARYLPLREGCLVRVTPYREHTDLVRRGFHHLPLPLGCLIYPKLNPLISVNAGILVPRRTIF